MGVSLERVQFKFASIIGELCSEPDILSQFAVWVDLKMAEYKAKGAMSLECSGCKPKPTWMRGVIPPEKAPIPEDDRLTERRTGIGVADDSARQSYSDCSDRPSVDERLSPELIIVKDEPRSPNETFHKNYYSDSTLNSLTPTSRKRYSEEAIGAHSSAKVKRMSSLPHGQSEQNSQANQSLLSVISGGDNENMDEERVSLVNRLLPPAPSAGTFPQSTWQHNQSTFNQADINLVQEDNSNNGMTQSECDEFWKSKGNSFPEPIRYLDSTEAPVSYYYIAGGSQKGKGKVMDSVGNSYVLKERKAGVLYWVCSVRNQRLRCPAAVIERNGQYSRGKRDHIHPVPVKKFSPIRKPRPNNDV